MNCHGENTLQPINKRMYFLNSCRISGHFDTKFTTVAQKEQILQESKDQNIDNILFLEHASFYFSWSRREGLCWAIVDINVMGLY